jgi:hypothetical protein
MLYLFKSRVRSRSSRIGILARRAAPLLAAILALPVAQPRPAAALPEQQEIDVLAARIDFGDTDLAGSAGATYRLGVGFTNPIGQASDQQSKSGLPPDADFLYSIRHARWWGGARVDHFDGGTGLLNGNGTLTRYGGGFDVRLYPGFVAGLAIIGRHADADAGGTDGHHFRMNGLTIVARALKTLGRKVWADATAFYGHDWFRFKYGYGAVDRYGKDRFGFGGGINAFHRFSPWWRVEGRLGWAGSWSSRKATVDSFGTPRFSSNVSFGRAAARLRFVRSFPGGEVFAEGTLRFVTNDTSIYNFDSRPVDGVLGGGVRIGLGGSTVLTARGHAVVGRKDYEEYGGSLVVQGNF